MSIRTKRLSKSQPSKLLPVQPTHRGAAERVAAILEAADELLRSTALEDFSLVTVARFAGIPNASIYHFFPSAEAVLVGLLRRYFEAMDAHLAAALVTASTMEWQALVRCLFENVRKFHVGHPNAARLVFHGGGFGGLQSVDEAHVMHVAQFSTVAFAVRFHMPVIEHVQRRVAIAIAISDRIWAMDMNNGQVSDFVFEESQRAVLSYLSNFLPPVLARRDDASFRRPRLTK